MKPVEGFVRTDEGELIFQYVKNDAKASTGVIRLTPEFVKEEKERQKRVYEDPKV